MALEVIVGDRGNKPNVENLDTYSLTCPSCGARSGFACHEMSLMQYNGKRRRTRTHLARLELATELDELEVW